MQARNRGRSGSSFDAAPTSSLQAADSAIFGAIADAEKRKIATPVSIFQIWPDPSQPRRTVPSVIREQWDGAPSTAGKMLALWFDLAQEEKGATISASAYIEAEAEDQGERGEIGPLERSLIDMLQLAGSIYRDGLTNPITGLKDSQGNYHIETGERRWLAYHFLYAYTESDAKWERILFAPVTEVNVWRQATENTARSALNAISRARQLAILLMDMLGPDNFKSRDEMIEATGSEQFYYAQVSDGEKFRIPRGSSERLLAAMGLKNPVQLRNYRALLRLPAELWKQADDESWDEGHIRLMIDADTVPIVTVSEVSQPEIIATSPITPPPSTTPTRDTMKATTKFIERSVKRAKQDPSVRDNLIKVFEQAIADLRQLP